ncbi:MAG TPA: hypothetical protein VG816_07260 [Solirubrobacterales bacterium]|nr:hypothetical protein [Solirubrobacterales bacterium]
MSPTVMPSNDHDGDCGKKKSGGNEVVLGGTRLADDKRVALQDNSGCDNRQMPATVGPPDAPRSKEREP